MTKIKKSFLILTLGALAFAIFSGGNLPYSVFYCFMFLLFGALIFAYITKKGFSLSLIVDNHYAFVGDEIKTIVKFYNDSIVPMPYVKTYSEFLKKGADKYRGDIISLKLNSNRFLDKKVRFNVRGIYDFGKVSCKCEDLFGIISWKKDYKTTGVCKVYPKIYNLDRIDIKGADETSYSSRGVAIYNKFSENNETVKNIREYRVGDNRKKINWKVTAKHGKIYIKEYESSQCSQIHLFLDFRSKPFQHDVAGEMEEELVEFFLSLVKHLENYNGRIKISIIGQEKKNFIVCDDKDFEVLNNYMVEHFSGGEGIVENYMSGILEYMSRKNSIAIVTSDIGKDNINYIIALAGRGFKVTLFYLTSGFEAGNKLIREAVNCGIACYNIREIR